VQETSGHGEKLDGLFGAISSAMETVGRRYQEGAYFLPELIASGALMENTLGIMEKYQGRSEQQCSANILLATTRGDLHDIGKNMFGMFLKSNGFKVYDLGVDVHSRKIIEAVEESS
jgi:methanogenic corrinoid protein MtbC1